MEMKSNLKLSSAIFRSSNNEWLQNTFSGFHYYFTYGGDLKYTYVLLNDHHFMQILNYNKSFVRREKHFCSKNKFYVYMQIVENYLHDSIFKRKKNGKLIILSSLLFYENYFLTYLYDHFSFCPSFFLSAWFNNEIN